MEQPTLTVTSDGTKGWRVDGQYHREDGPAVIEPSGAWFWYKNGVLHRTDGPAAVYADGIEEWWIGGVQVDPLIYFLEKYTTNG